MTKLILIATFFQDIIINLDSDNSFGDNSDPARVPAQSFNFWIDLCLAWVHRGRTNSHTSSYNPNPIKQPNPIRAAQKLRL